jgi:hypothetical protein
MTVTGEAPLGFKLDGRGKRKASSAERSELYLRSGGFCEYCEAPLNGSWEVEHAYPDDVDTLLYAACSVCNRSKGARKLDTWAQLHADDWWIYEQRDEWDGIYRIFLTDEIDYDMPRQIRVVVVRAYEKTFQRLRRLYKMDPTFGTPDRSKAIAQRLAHLVLPRAPIKDDVMRRELTEMVSEMDRRGWTGDDEADEENDLD